MNIYIIPDFFEPLLEHDRTLRAALDLTLENFSPWLKDSKLPFFEDYTDHGPDHIREVLATSANLLTEHAKSVFSSEDAATYILAVLLHDAAMHLTPAGFEALIKGDAAHQRIEEFDDASQSWPNLWSQYLYSVQRWDDLKLRNVLGERAAEELRGTVRDPFDHYHNLQDTDRKLIGDFIRRHHPRMAHEFACYGVPGPTGERLHIYEGKDRFSIQSRDLAGLIARSHGLPLRDCLDYLKIKEYAHWQPQVHAVFLMALLRIADYIQIQSDRAISPRFDYKYVDSPLSRLEHRTHQAIRQAYISHDEPEVLRIMAMPEDVFVYLRLKEWIAGIQAELDAAWTILGEVYGLNKLGFTLRRVRSNIEKESNLSKHIDFEPRLVEMSVARAELLKLLVRPLYENKPEVGIRELMQNAVDAVRELWALQEKDGSLKDLPLIEQEGDVEIWLDDPDPDGSAWLTVSDRGVGMTPDIICDYFLRVGASYRHSEAWQKLYERDETERSVGDTKSRVLRSGRFGIGMLAAFLLGDEIEVSTRHFSAKQTGLRFSTRLDSGPIELKHDVSIPVGTTIRIRVSREVYEELAPSYYQDEWDWYCLSRPQVVRRIGRQGTKLEQGAVVPGPDDPLPPGWYPVPGPGFDAIHVDMNRSQPDWLVCNGIRILSGTIYKWFDYYSPDLLFILTTPLVSVFDSDALLPLNLQRTEIETRWLPFADEGYELLAKTLLADMLLFAPERASDYSHMDALRPRLYCSSFWDLRPWLHTPEGITLVEDWYILNAGLRSFVVFGSEREAGLSTIINANAYDAVMPLAQRPLSGSRMDGYELIAGVDMINGHGWNHLRTAGTRLLTGAEYANSLLVASKQYFRRNGHRPLEAEWSNGVWTLLVSGKCPATQIDVTALSNLSPTLDDENMPPLIAEWFLEPIQPVLESNGLASYWNDIICHPVIPYDLNERRTKLAHAYKTLAPYMRREDSKSKP